MHEGFEHWAAWAEARSARLARRFRRWRLRRATIAALGALEDGALKDVGVARGGIPGLARRRWSGAGEAWS
jgi:uncharacterized protein YjiS (DUF1127 family)